MVSKGTSSVPMPQVQASIRSFFSTQPTSPPVDPVLPVATPQPAVKQSNVPSYTPEHAGIRRVSSSNFVLPPQASITRIEPHHIQALRRINSLLLPISYPDKFYNRILEPSTPHAPNSFSRVVLWKDGNVEPKVIGGVVCRIDPNESSPNASDLYIQSLALLSPYRSKGLVTAVLEDILLHVREQREHVSIVSLYAHVWTQNKEALAWYEGRDFAKEGEMINDYYRRLKPDTAWILRRKLTPSDLVPSQRVSRPSQTPLSRKGSRVSVQMCVRPSLTAHTTSFQDRRPDREWNDLPDDVLGGSDLLKPPTGGWSADGSQASSRCSSRSEGREKGGKKKRAYPAAAYVEGQVS